MKTHVACSALATMLLSLLATNMADAQLASTCVENSPERRGEVGCSIIESNQLPGGLKGCCFGTSTVLIPRSVPAKQLAGKRRIRCRRHVLAHDA
jgi:hypothetical protein